MLRPNTGPTQAQGLRSLHEAVGDAEEPGLEVKARDHVGPCAGGAPEVFQALSWWLEETSSWAPRRSRSRLGRAWDPASAGFSGFRVQGLGLGFRLARGSQPLRS